MWCHGRRCVWSNCRVTWGTERNGEETATVTVWSKLRGNLWCGEEEWIGEGQLEQGVDRNVASSETERKLTQPGNTVLFFSFITKWPALSWIFSPKKDQKMLHVNTKFLPVSQVQAVTYNCRPLNAFLHPVPPSISDRALLCLKAGRHRPLVLPIRVIKMSMEMYWQGIAKVLGGKNWPEDLHKGQGETVKSRIRSRGANIQLVQGRKMADIWDSHSYVAADASLLLDPEGDGNKVLRNVGNSSPTDRASHPTSVESSVVFSRMKVKWQVLL